MKSTACFQVGPVKHMPDVISDSNGKLCVGSYHMWRLLSNPDNYSFYLFRHRLSLQTSQKFDKFDSGPKRWKSNGQLVVKQIDFRATVN